MKHTARQLAFVGEYLKDLNATQAAIRAGYSPRTAQKNASRLMANEGIAELIQKAMAERAKRLSLDSDRVLQGIANVAFFDLAHAFERDEATGAAKLRSLPDMPRDVRDSVLGIDVHHDGGDMPGFTVKLKVDSRLKALELLGRHLKLFVDRHQIEGPGYAELVEASLKPKAPGGTS